MLPRHDVVLTGEQQHLPYPAAHENLYVSRVIETVACPRSSCTSLGCVSLLNSSVAAVWRVAAWKVVSGKLAFLRIFLKEVVIIQGCIGLPD
jgi:hypothetical protein